MAAIDYRGAHFSAAEQCWQELVRVVNELMLEEAEASRDYEQRHAWTD